MSLEDVSVVRKNLSEGLYIMLDENLGGGVIFRRTSPSFLDMRPGSIGSPQGRSSAMCCWGRSSPPP